MKTAVRVLRDTYLDSVLQLLGARAMHKAEGVEWATVVMATAANLEALRHEGFDPPEAGPYDLILAVRAADDAGAVTAFAEGERAMFGAREGGPVEQRPRSLEEALRRQPGSTVAVISVPGDYAALEAHKALSHGLDVLLFSDNVSLADEIALKDHAVRQGRLLMGPGAGTAMLAGVGLGFANVVRPGPVGIVAAAGTGAQEVMSLLDREGVGLSHVIGVGGRDLTRAVGGRMAERAVEALDDDPATELILLVSKPPDEEVARRVVAAAGDTPLVAALVGLERTMPGVHVTDTLEGGVVKALELLGRPAPDFDRRHGPSLEEVIACLAPTRTTVRGLFSGGTLCSEALVLLGRTLGPVWSNVPIDPRYGLPAPSPGSSICLDLGEEEYTRGRPHPMIDPEARVKLLREAGQDADVAVVLLDVVLGHGSHPDPAGILAPEISSLDGPQVVAYVLGTERDPQGYREQVSVLAEAGCVVTETAARAALTAAAIATRRAAS
ncbi:FdrA family protein [Streptosporangium sp. NPDC000396]|uniref:FdrA family protein n=1 Tax=Streptosporangium sp. NPDC000396 TaxID=3366185 RepID=UPI0036826124